jgi:hypothetical protein
MPKYLVLYKLNPATWPADPKVALKMAETNFAAGDELEKAGIIKEQGSFNPGDGYLIGEMPSLEEAYKFAHRMWPFVTMEIREIIPWEKTKEIALSVLREQAK